MTASLSITKGPEFTPTLSFQDAGSFVVGPCDTVSLFIEPSTLGFLVIDSLATGSLIIDCSVSQGPHALYVVQWDRGCIRMIRDCFVETGLAQKV